MATALCFENLDHISLREIPVQPVIGVHATERVVRQNLFIDLDLCTQLEQAAHSDRIRDSIDFAHVASSLQQFVKDTQRLTLEALAADISKHLLKGFPSTQQIRVVIYKPKGLWIGDKSSIEIRRNRSSVEGVAEEAQIIGFDRICLHGLRVQPRLSVAEADHEQPQSLLLDVTFHTDLRAAGENDDITQTINYAAAADELAKLGLDNHFKTLEAFAEAAVEDLLTKFPLAQRVTVEAAKPHGLLQGGCGKVVITRGREVLPARDQ